jgi:Mce-associated membrane protein
VADDADAVGEELKEEPEASATEVESNATEAGAIEDYDTEAGEHAEKEAALEPVPKAPGAPAPRRSGVRLAVAIGLVAVLALAALVGWLGYRAYQSHQAQDKRNLFVQVGRQGAVNLTTISYTEAEADVQRILDSATGTFYDDFQKRAPAFVEVVKQAQSKSRGTVTEAGLESEDGDHGRVLVAVTVKTSNAGATEQEPRAWRMRLTVQKVGDGAKVSSVEFVP